MSINNTYIFDRTTANNSPLEKAKQVLIDLLIDSNSEVLNGLFKEIKDQAELIFTNSSLQDLIQSFDNKDTLIVTDIYNYSKVSNWANKSMRSTIVCVENCNINNINNLEKNYCNYNTVIGLGGCTARDAAGVLGKNSDFIVIPTILSTSCISSCKSILTDENGNKVRIKTKPPKKTIISYQILQNKDSQKWSASGFADSISRISTSIDYEINYGTPKYDRIKGNVMEIYNLLSYIVSKPYINIQSKEFITVLSRHLHKESIASNLGIHGFSEVLNAGTSQEHVLCYAIKWLTEMSKIEIKASHGELTTIGTLFAAMFLKKEFGISEIYNDLRSAFKILGLPISLKQLKKLGVTAEIIEKGVISENYQNTYLGKYFAEHNNIKKYIFDVYN